MSRHVIAILIIAAVSLGLVFSSGCANNAQTYAAYGAGGVGYVIGNEEDK